MFSLIRYSGDDKIPNEKLISRDFVLYIIVIVHNVFIEEERIKIRDTRITPLGFSFTIKSAFIHLWHISN